jgi:hypothetical protein
MTYKWTPVPYRVVRANMGEPASVWHCRVKASAVYNTWNWGAHAVIHVPLTCIVIQVVGEDEVIQVCLVLGHLVLDS